MSSLFVKVCRFERLVHPNADSMFIAVPDGTTWQCCCRTDNFDNEDLGIYIPVDSLLPVELAAELNLPNTQPDKPYRIRTIRLRSRLSQGLLLPNKGRFKEGEDVAEALGITKHVEPEPDDEDLRIAPANFLSYTNIENIKNFPDVLVDGEEVVMTEKIHGKTFRCAWIDGEFYVGSANTAFKREVSNKWDDVAVLYDLKFKLRDSPNVIVYGELFGAGVQSLRYGLDNNWDLRVFDVFIGNEDRYMDYDECLAFCQKMNLPVVPTLYRGQFNQNRLEFSTNGYSIENKGTHHVREGIVVKPTKERWDFDNGLGRVILKSINPDYLLKNYD